jgi:hypothetical protein
MIDKIVQLFNREPGHDPGLRVRSFKRRFSTGYVSTFRGGDLLDYDARRSALGPVSSVDETRRLL